MIINNEGISINTETRFYGDKQLFKFCISFAEAVLVLLAVFMNHAKRHSVVEDKDSKPDKKLYIDQYNKEVFARDTGVKTLAVTIGTAITNIYTGAESRTAFMKRLPAPLVELDASEMFHNSIFSHSMVRHAMLTEKEMILIRSKDI